ncbi:BT_3928 family protein [Olivibacter sitiensis]|uniref:BT_3928 family protein n=1 Tax=Olivibacter sitiensis TaxID=376470 RepID=UPI00040F38B2|nr:BT_3928 family protein [Olivibacter sitiensis]
MNAHTYATARRPNYPLLVCRLLVGLLFIFSGLIKANDPVGFGYKLEEYFEVFHLTVFSDYAVAIAILLCALEIILGAFLLLGFAGRLVAWGLLLLIFFFSFLTFYSAYFEVVKSCGCFGDAIPLTPWQSFGKDVFLFILILVIFIYRKQIKPITNSLAVQMVLGSLIVIVSFGAGIYTYNYLPVIDFLPYKEGNNLPEQMHVPEGAPADEYQIQYDLKHKQSGEEKTVTDKVYMDEKIWEDDQWEIIGEPESKLIKKGFSAPIQDLRITDAGGETDFNDEILANPYYNLLVVAYDLTETNLDALAKINATALNASEQYNVRTVLLTASSATQVDELDKHLKLFMEPFYADAIPLKSTVRSNPGVLLMKDGTVVKKWHYHTFPQFENLAKDYFSKEN